jgi:signal transduction histidine kinase/GAF domain-containing protein
MRRCIRAQGATVVGTRRRDAEQIASGERELRSVAQLNMLHNLAARLNRLNDVQGIGEAITAELKTLIDYHNCRVYLLAPDGSTLEPVAFRGELTEYQGETHDDLVTRVGEGITGHVAETRESFYAPDARKVPFARLIPGTADVLESILAAPLQYGDRVTGVIMLSNLGYDKFDDEDMRMLEVLAAHAAIAFENARLFQMEREAAETASALLGLSQALTGVHDVVTALARSVAAVPTIVPIGALAAYVRDSETGLFTLAQGWSLPAEWLEAGRAIDDDTAAGFFPSTAQPLVLGRDELANAPPKRLFAGTDREILTVQLRWKPDGLGALVLVAPNERSSFSQRDLLLARGIADITSLALGNARRVHELERFHELVASLKATFWEADPSTLEFTFLSDRAALMLRGGGHEPKHWGDHILQEDREVALGTAHLATQEGGDHSVEYRASGPNGKVLWLRDSIHAVRDAKTGTVALRGLMVDITERKRAERALRRSERKYSEAFRREREATQRLRALDDMKNTFLEAVSHDLRTPLTSILGSALTLEQAGTSVTEEESLDLVHRIAINARKLERLLSDLLDLDRLQRGIISPQRRPTDIGELVRQTIQESDLLGGRAVEVEAESIVIAVDAAKVERIVENLLANAARHTPEGCRLWAGVHRRRDGALIFVDDDGPGVPKELREAVFEPFRQVPHAPNHSPGVGVGLSLVARFAELHGGRAWVEERPGGGASFRVFLPDA